MSTHLKLHHLYLKKSSITIFDTKSASAGPEPKTIFTHHADCIDEAEYLRSLLLKVSNV